MQWKVNWHGNLLINGENLSQDKNPKGWFLGYHFQESLIKIKRLQVQGILHPKPSLSQSTYLQ